jgi:hypothetical protein
MEQEIRSLVGCRDVVVFEIRFYSANNLATSPDFLSWSLLGNSGSYCSVTAKSKSDMSYDIWTTIAWTILYQYRDWEYTVDCEIPLAQCRSPLRLQSI